MVRRACGMPCWVFAVHSADAPFTAGPFQQGCGCVPSPARAQHHITSRAGSTRLEAVAKDPDAEATRLMPGGQRSHRSDVLLKTANAQLGFPK
jgi:hypothetical protein